jgi:predicted aldo/keto reductase-like oxidoreductase
MEYRRFGRTELSMPVISVGGMRFQTSWKREDPVRKSAIANLEAIVSHALERGLNHFETAFGYGTSEAELGEVLPHLDRSRLIIQTKGGAAEDASHFSRDFENSMNCLKVEYLDLFAVHGINNDAILDATLQPGGVLDQVMRLRDAGVIRHVGFSTHGPLPTILRAIDTGRFDYVNLWYSYIYQENGPAIQAARDRDMGVFIISPNDKGGHLYAPPEKLLRLCAPLSPMAFNDLFILSHPEIHTLSCGAARPSDLDEHVQAVLQRSELAETVQAVRQNLDQALEAVYGADWARDFGRNLPTWENTPGGINLPIILWLWNVVQAFDMHDFARARYNLIGNAQHWFPGNQADGLAKVDPGQLRRALAGSPFRDRIMTILPDVHALLGGEEVQRLSQS